MKCWNGKKKTTIRAMKKIDYPDRRKSDFTTLVSDYTTIFPTSELDAMEIEWLNWKRREVLDLMFPETVEELLVADVDVIADVYERFKTLRPSMPLRIKDPNTGKSVRNPKLKELDDIFQYTKKYDDNIAKFFTDHAKQLNIGSCYYCETAYINVYQTDRRQFDVDHFIPKEKCPILGLSLFNFVPSCQVCNSRIKLAKDIGANKVEYEAFNPAGENYSFNGNVKIHLRLNPGFSPDLDNQDAYYVYFRCRRGFRKVVEFFHLTERYEFHKLEALRIKKLKAQYPKSARTKIADLLGITEAKVKEDLFHEQYLQNNNRCFAKLTRDMLH